MEILRLPRPGVNVSPRWSAVYDPRGPWQRTPTPRAPPPSSRGCATAMPRGCWWRGRLAQADEDGAHSGGVGDEDDDAAFRPLGARTTSGCQSCAVVRLVLPRRNFKGGFNRFL
jgi:hypothetical protein